MEILSEDIEGNLVIDFEATLNATVFGDITIKNSVMVIINDTINGDITIEKYSRVILYGKLNGSIINNGICEVYGEVNGKISDHNQNVLIDANAIIRNS